MNKPSNRIRASINVSKILKEHLVHGEKGVYLDLVLIPIPENDYGDDYLVKQDIPSRKLPEGFKVEVLGHGIIQQPKGIPF